LLLPNRVAGFSGMVGLGFLFFWRHLHDAGHFGDSYRAYNSRTGRIFPCIF